MSIKMALTHLPCGDCAYALPWPSPRSITAKTEMTREALQPSKPSFGANYPVGLFPVLVVHIVLRQNKHELIVYKTGLSVQDRTLGSGMADQPTCSISEPADAKRHESAVYRLPPL
ncbi:hypothetical protein BKA67DRAFT_664947 [Truncatella angustata]|uniref:Uncharacterized protein n=1 Tax=Truncatella angustata TaxID=152316 RepID=A0A9P8UAR2_9PEZI|nr:uncharacterized protein BKA67DRAFT_664947 [Truncatella angustata]KAH6645107.1 hypothetical protein BKA67DRAFT_664947 [Truncatella angustata]